MPRNTTLYYIPGTTTFRLASSGVTVGFTETSSIELGTNLQNQPKELRKIYIPDEGKIFCQVDQAGAEALIVAYLTRHSLFRDLFLNKIKPHTFVAMHVFAKQLQEKLDKRTLDIRCDIGELLKCEIKDLASHPFWKAVERMIKDSDNWSAEERYYYIGKQICHSSNYGIKAFRFSMNTLGKSKGRIVITKQQAEQYLSLYHSLFPEIREWHRMIERQVRETKYLYSLFGFPRYFSSLFEQENDFKEAYSFIPQSTVGTITNIAFAKHQTLIESTGLPHDLLANTHDSYLVQCPIGEEKECCKLMSSLLNQELVAPNGEHFFMKSEAKVGSNWGEYHEEKNTQGLREIALN